MTKIQSTDEQWDALSSVSGVVGRLAEKLNAIVKHGETTVSEILEIATDFESEIKYLKEEIK